MGKIASVIQFTGRTGNVVGVTGPNGDIYLRVHKKHINDKNSAEQIATRVKFALAGSLSKLIPSDLIYGMSGNGRRGRRQRWQKLLMKKMTTTAVDGTVTATLAPSDLIFSEGAYCAGTSVSGVTVADGKVSMSVSLSDRVSQLLMVAVFAKSRSGGFSAVDSAVATESGSLEIPLPDSEFTVANLYAIPITQNEQLSGVYYGNEVNAEGESVSSYATTAEYYNSNRYQWMNSVFVGSFSAS
ncbi:MAG: hypothetical protein K6E96_08920 [Bacteroidales bacterium]|nr:hypothetical protein [Bacteroidales bacterium]